MIKNRGAARGENNHSKTMCCSLQSAEANKNWVATPWVVRPYVQSTSFTRNRKGELSPLSWTGNTTMQMTLGYAQGCLNSTSMEGQGFNETVRASWVVKSLKPHVLCYGENQSVQNSVSQGVSTSHRGVKTNRRHKFPRILSEEKGSGPAHSFNSNQLHGGELQLPAHLTKETSQPKLYQPLSRDGMSCRRTSNSNWAAQPNRTTKANPVSSENVQYLRWSTWKNVVFSQFGLSNCEMSTFLSAHCFALACAHVALKFPSVKTKTHGGHSLYFQINM